MDPGSRGTTLAGVAGAGAGSPAAPYTRQELGRNSDFLVGNSALQLSLLVQELMGFVSYTIQVLYNQVHLD